MVLVSHPTGNTFVRALLDGLADAGRLGLLATTLNVRRDAAWLKLLPGGMRSELLRRSCNQRPELVASRPMRELVRLISQRAGLRAITRHEHGWASVDAVYRDQDRWVARNLPRWSSQRRINSVYAYEDGALETFRAAAALGLQRVYDLPIAYWETSRRILEEEALRLPEWSGTLVGTSDSNEKLQRKAEEFAAAEVVVCPSSFVLESLPQDAQKSKRCMVAQFGTPDVPQIQTSERPRRGDRFRVLFAGSMTQRKGLADVFAAFKQLNRSDMELVVMGSPVVPLEFYRKQYGEFVYEAPRPHADVLALMRTCDVLVLPSLVEGRALVQQEAMACGLPIIVTFNAGGSDLIEEGKTGFLVPIRSPQAVAEKLSWCADHRGDTREMGRLARAKAVTLTWHSYSAKILTALRASGSIECAYA